MRLSLCVVFFCAFVNGCFGKAHPTRKCYDNQPCAIRRANGTEKVSCTCPSGPCPTDDWDDATNPHVVKYKGWTKSGDEWHKVMFCGPQRHETLCTKSIVAYILKMPSFQKGSTVLFPETCRCSYNEYTTYQFNSDFSIVAAKCARHMQQRCGTGEKCMQMSQTTGMATINCLCPGSQHCGKDGMCHA